MSEFNPVTCKRCSHEWKPQVEKPKYCPECKSPYWDKEYRRKGYQTASGEMKRTVEQQVGGTPAVEFAPAESMTYEQRVLAAMERLRQYSGK